MQEKASYAMITIGKQLFVQTFLPCIFPAWIAVGFISDHRIVQCLKICLTLGLLLGVTVFVSLRFRATLRAVSKT